MPIETAATGLTCDWQLASGFEFSNIVVSAYGIVGTASIHRQTPALDGFLWWRGRRAASGG